jgi:hypothetical protein
MTERLFDAAVGALAGAVWGLLMATAIFLSTETWHATLIGWSAGVFGLIGFLFSNFAFEALLALIHFLWGVLNGIASAETFSRPHDSGEKGYLRSVLLLGFGTGIVLSIWLWAL